MQDRNLYGQFVDLSTGFKPHIEFMPYNFDEVPLLTVAHVDVLNREDVRGKVPVGVDILVQGAAAYDVGLLVVGKHEDFVPQAQEWEIHYRHAMGGLMVERLQELNRTVHRLPDHVVVAAVHATDTAILDAAPAILERFYAMDADIVFAGRASMYPDKNTNFDAQADEDRKLSPLVHPSGCCFIGYAAALRRMAGELLAGLDHHVPVPVHFTETIAEDANNADPAWRSIAHEQRAFQKYYWVLGKQPGSVTGRGRSAPPSRHVAVDTHQRLFADLDPTRRDLWLGPTARVECNPEGKADVMCTGAAGFKPAFLHATGDAKFEYAYMMARLGYMVPSVTAELYGECARDTHTTVAGRALLRGDPQKPAHVPFPPPGMPDVDFDAAGGAVESWGAPPPRGQPDGHAEL
ncbi:unnamed protein product [Pedinophyceae sp. YPF-701]|nr:unnamed protein product [Pedinophyceae sp. YPF-701]